MTFRLFALCIHFLEQCTEQDYKVDVVKIGLIQLMVRCCAPLRVFYGHNSVNRTHWLQIHLDGFVDHPLINCRDFIVSAIGWVFLSSECQQSDTHVLVLYTKFPKCLHFCLFFLYKMPKTYLSVTNPQTRDYTCIHNSACFRG